ncbi:hypothetical protein BBP00_00002569 [Phytophthora kernoviae]|uniref:Necrosis inducing-like protein NPP1 type n=1 Tax=Phytophthora kernoviae TaxID=325452 RepID=A0A3F2RYN1_9STRA|nr:hypothetical protein BBP00_00002569 [Phytophthora kernoviae]
MKLFAVFCSAAAALSAAEAVTIGHDKVQPFPQPDPVTVSEKAAVKFKPSLRIDSGCHSYPAVNAAGEIISIFRKGRRHDWVNVVVWLDNPAADKPTMIGVSPSSYVSSYSKYTPPPVDGLNGMSCMINYLTDANNHGYHTVDTTWKRGGEFQDLVMWEQLTDAARISLNETEFGETAQVPFIDENFVANLEKAWPY